MSSELAFIEHIVMGAAAIVASTLTIILILGCIAAVRAVWCILAFPRVADVVGIARREDVTRVRRIDQVAI